MIRPHFSCSVLINAGARSGVPPKGSGPKPRELRNDLRLRDHLVEGVQWIVDYETSCHEGSDIDAFLNWGRERYAPQLAAYAALFKNS